MSGWGNVPGREAAFAGREEELDAIRGGLLAGGPVAVHAVNGAGGTGMTSVAVEYAHRHAADYDLIWWLESRDRVLLGQRYAELAMHLGHDGDGDPPEDMRRAASAVLERRPGWLLIFADVTDPATIGPWLPEGPGHVLITSYKDYWRGIATPVPVGRLSRAGAVGLLRRRLPDVTDEDADTLASALSDSALALTQAAVQIAATGTWRSPPGHAGRLTGMRVPQTGRAPGPVVPPPTATARYVRLHAGHAAELGRRGGLTSARDYLTPVISLAYRRLRDTDPDAAALVAICAHLNSSPIPVGWLTGAADALPDSLGTRLGDDQARQGLLDAITGSALATLDDRGLTMHYYTPEAIRRSNPDALPDARPLAMAVLISAAPADPESPQSWPAWARLHPHLPRLPPPPQEAGPALRDMLLAAVRYLISSGNPDDAETRASWLHSRWEQALGPDHEETLRAAAAWAAAYRALGVRHGAYPGGNPGAYRMARTIGERILARRRRLHGADAPATLAAASDLSDTLSAVGDHEAARALDADTRRRRRRVLGKDHPDTIRSAAQLARDRQALGETGWRGLAAGLRRWATARRRWAGDLLPIRARPSRPGH